MRRKNREVVAFGIASLDLFASALGAFILVSIVVFPFIARPMDRSTGPVTEAVPIALDEIASGAEPEACPVCPEIPPPIEPAPCPALNQPCPVCPEVARLECPAPETLRVIAPSANYQFPHLDLVIALDVTSSMGRQVDALRAEVGQLGALMSRLAPSFAIGVVAFGDRAWERPLTVFPLREITGSPANFAAFRRYVEGLSVQVGQGSGMNPDPPEAVLQALREAVATRWRPNAQERVIVLITDASAYPEEIPQVVTLAQRTVGASAGPRLSTVYINSSGVVDMFVEAFLQRVAVTGRGEFVRDAGGSLTVNLLLSLF